MFPNTVSIAGPQSGFVSTTGAEAGGSRGPSVPTSKACMQAAFPDQGEAHVADCDGGRPGPQPRRGAAKPIMFQCEV